MESSSAFNAKSLCTALTLLTVVGALMLGGVTNPFLIGSLLLAALVLAIGPQLAKGTRGLSQRTA